MFLSKLLPFSRYQISGHSMRPLFKEGQVVWVNHWAYLFSKPKVGDIIIFKFQEKEIIKRVSEVMVGKVAVSGDNKSDSLATGLVEFRDIKGKVLQ